MNHQKKALLIILLFAINFTFGQLKNEVTTIEINLLNGETKQGFTNKTDEKSLSQGIDFKSSESDKDFIHYDTSNLKSFSTFNNLKFEVQSIKVNDNTTPIKVFCQLLLKGKASLYKSYYNNDVIYIIVKDNTSYVLQNDELITNQSTMTTYHYTGYLNMAINAMQIKNTKISFDEKVFIKIITEYNKQNQSESEIFIADTEKTVHFLMVFGGIGTESNGKVTFFQAMDRIFFPSISRTTSLNFGLNYINDKYQVDDIYNPKKKHDVIMEIVTIPLTIQQNFSTKSFRPYIFTGIGMTYKNQKSDIDSKLIPTQAKEKFGATFSYGAGLEVDIIKGIMAKVEYKFELYNYFLFGIGYRF